MGWVGVLIVREMEKRSCDDGEVVMVSEGEGTWTQDQRTVI